MINKFDGPYSFLSNFFSTSVTYDGLTYPSTEAAYQAQKTQSQEEKIPFTTETHPGKTKRMGRKVAIRPDWDNMKDDVMTKICFIKFSSHNNLLKLLLDTKDQKLVEGNTWHDNYWGDCSCDKCKNIAGQNHLGKILMSIRDFIHDALCKMSGINTVINDAMIKREHTDRLIKQCINALKAIR